MNDTTSILLTLKDGFSYKAIVSVLITGFAFLYGGEMYIVQGVIILILFDLITGILKSAKQNRESNEIKKCSLCVAIISFLFATNSKGLRHTGRKAVEYMLLIIAAWWLGRISPNMILNELYIWTACFIGITEFLSIAENLSQAGILIPKWFIERLQKILKTGEFK